MHTTEAGTANVPAFLTKLWKLVEDSMYDDLISWSQNGRSFLIQNQSRFSRDLLPLYFKHNNMASFIRQLNMYGFRKLTGLENGGLNSHRDEIEFFHQYFIKGQEHQLEHIKRKVNGTKQGMMSPGEKDTSRWVMQTEDYNQILHDVRAMKDRQDSMNSCLHSLQRENHVLWKEIHSLRNKNHRQQQIVERLIQFMMNLVGPQNRGSNKRKGPYMIEDTSGPMPKRLQAGEHIRRTAIHDVTDDVIDADLEAVSSNESMISLPAGSSSSGMNVPGSSGSNFYTLENVESDQVVNGSIPSEYVHNLNTMNPNPMGPVSSHEVSNAHPGSSSPMAPLNHQMMDHIGHEPSIQTCNPFDKNLLDHCAGIDEELNWLQEQLHSGTNSDPNSLFGAGSPLPATPPLVLGPVPASGGGASRVISPSVPLTSSTLSIPPPLHALHSPQIQTSPLSMVPMAGTAPMGTNNHLHHHHNQPERQHNLSSNHMIPISTSINCTTHSSNRNPSHGHNNQSNKQQLLELDLNQHQQPNSSHEWD